MSDLTDMAANASQEVSFDGLVREALELISANAPNWTNHNPSDPGITLVELLAWLSEMLVYRARRISPDAKLNLLRLLNGETWSGWIGLKGRPPAEIDEAIERRITALSEVQCAVTAPDFEELAVRFAAEHLRESSGTVQAVATTGEALLELIDAGTLSEGGVAEVGVILAPDKALTGEKMAQVCEYVRERIQPLCLLASRVHVVGPVYLRVEVSCVIVLQTGYESGPVLAAVDRALLRHFGPAHATSELAARGRLGHPIYESEIAAVIDSTPGVDYAEDIRVWRIERHGRPTHELHPLVGIRIGVIATVGRDTCPGGSASYAYERFGRDTAGEIVSVAVRACELGSVALAPGKVDIRHSGMASGPGRGAPR